jgi:hypothetical protein
MRHQEDAGSSERGMGRAMPKALRDLNCINNAYTLCCNTRPIHGFALHPLLLSLRLLVVVHFVVPAIDRQPYPHNPKAAKTYKRVLSPSPQKKFLVRRFW